MAKKCCFQFFSPNKTYKRYILQKNGSKLVIFGLSSPIYNLHPPYRALPPCARFHNPDNREIQHRNVLVCLLRLFVCLQYQFVCFLCLSVFVFFFVSQELQASQCKGSGVNQPVCNLKCLCIHQLFIIVPVTICTYLIYFLVICIHQLFIIAVTILTI